ncbi:MAG: sensor histidine kinase [Bacteroidota bacterium]|jgi:two-component system sensor histidine kinase CiaH
MKSASTPATRFRRTTVLYWTLLAYVVAALIWWFISLEKQNQQIAEKERNYLLEHKLELSQAAFDEQWNKIQRAEQKNFTKYLSEGITFLALIGLGASWVYRSVRRRFRLQKQQEEFIMAVTHELKTPIAVARLNLETIQRYPLDEEKRERLVKTTLDETARLNFLTNNILVASQLAGQSFRSERNELNLAGLLRDCIRDFQKRFPNRELIAHIPEEVVLNGDPLLLQILVNNLLENAQKYAPKDSPIKLNLSQESTAIRLEVIDQGPGIPRSERKQIFERFYRIENETTRKTAGTGLGLYLCKKIAANHQATISVSDHLPRGSNFAVVFPA